jgi:ketosteroid isomerase-like protein
MSKTLLARTGWPLILLLLATPLLTSQVRPAEETQAEIRSFLAEFVTAFDNLDWEKFRNAFADDATVFYPRDKANRATGRIEFEQHFKQVFEQIRAGRSKGPYMDIQPRELRIQLLGEVAIVTFHLDDRPGFINRRTLLLKKTTAGWKIAHLHASEVASAATPVKP